MIGMYDEKCAGISPERSPRPGRLKPGLRYAMLCGDGRRCYSSRATRVPDRAPFALDPEEKVRRSFAWIKGAAGPASPQQVRSSPTRHRRDEVATESRAKSLALISSTST